MNTMKYNQYTKKYECQCGSNVKNFDTHLGSKKHRQWAEKHKFDNPLTTLGGDVESVVFSFFTDVEKIESGVDIAYDPLKHTFVWCMRQKSLPVMKWLFANNKKDSQSFLNTVPFCQWGVDGSVDILIWVLNNAVRTHPTSRSINAVFLQQAFKGLFWNGDLDYVRRLHENTCIGTSEDMLNWFAGGPHQSLFRDTSTELVQYVLEKAVTVSNLEGVINKAIRFFRVDALDYLVELCANTPTFKKQLLDSFRRSLTRLDNTPGDRGWRPTPSYQFIYVRELDPCIVAKRRGVFAPFLYGGNGTVVQQRHAVISCLIRHCATVPT